MKYHLLKDESVVVNNQSKINVCVNIINQSLLLLNTKASSEYCEGFFINNQVACSCSLAQGNLECVL